MINYLSKGLQSYQSIRSVVLASLPRENRIPSLFKVYVPSSWNPFEKSFKLEKYSVVCLSKNDLKESYAEILKCIEEIKFDMFTGASSSSLFAAGWLGVTGQGLLDSSVALTALAVGSVYIFRKGKEEQDLKKGLKWNICLNGPAKSDALNLAVEQIIAGDAPRLKVNMLGIQIFGPLGNINEPSLAKKRAISEIYEIRVWKVPHSMLADSVKPLAEMSTKSWWTRFTIISIKADHSSFVYRIYHFFFPVSVSEERKRLDQYFSGAKSSDQVMELLVDKKHLDGSLSFLKQWAKTKSRIGVRVTPDGSVILYNLRDIPISTIGPYFSKFPERSIFSNGKESETFYVDESFPSVLLPFLMMGGILYGTQKSNRSRRDRL